MRKMVTIERLRVASYIAVVVFLLVLPMFMDVFSLNRFGGYLAYGMAGVAIAICWGNGGILNLGQGVFFGLGAYALAMSLTLSGLSSSQSVPPFMRLNAEPGAVEELCCIGPGSWLWIPFQSQAFGLLMGVVLPVAVALIIALPMFYRRITGVYVAITTLAMVVAVQLVIINNQLLTGGFNGLASLGILELGGVAFDPYMQNTYYLLAVLLSILLLGGRYLITSRAGLILRAIQSNEERMRYLGYNTEMYKLLFFAISAGVAGLAGMAYVSVASFASPALMDVAFSVSMVVWAAVGGRSSLLGACLGAILVSWVGDTMSESSLFQPLWPIALGGLFIAAVLFFPSGFAGWLDSQARRFLHRAGGTSLPGHGEGVEPPVSRGAETQVPRELRQ